MTRIGYRKDDIDYILDHYNQLRSGIWPDSISSDSGTPGISYRARFEGPCLLAGEVAARVKLCGDDGLRVEERFGMVTGVPKSEAEIERERHIPLYDLVKSIKRVTWYCVGSRRGWHTDKKGVFRAMSYLEWLHDNHDRRIVRGYSGAYLTIPRRKLDNRMCEMLRV